MDKISDPKFDLKVRSRGEQIFQSLGDSDQSIFNKDWWYGKIMDWSMKDQDFKTQMFRFVDVLPYLNSSAEVSRHLKEYFKDTEGGMAGLFNFGVGVGRLAPGLMASTVRKNITQMARMFITGESPLDAIPKIENARKKNITFTADLLGEATLSEMEALEYQSRYIELIDELSNRALSWKDNPVLDTDDQGPIPKVNISVKLSALYSQINERAWDESKRNIKERVRPVFSMAKQRGVFVNIDMESYHHKDLTLEVFKELLLEDEFKDYPHFGIVIQAYLRDSFEDTIELIKFAKTRKTAISVRLVKGAYWDYECIHADQHGWPVPVYTNKKESDWNYERCALEFLKAHPYIKLAAASHNVRSLATVIELADELGLPKNAFEVQMLFGMADPIKHAMVKQGYRVREYATIGELIPGMAYLVRRLLENTSNESFLKSKFSDDVSIDVLLQNPGDQLKASTPTRPKKEGVFYNEAMLDYVHAEHRQNTQKAIEKFQTKYMGKDYPIVINGKKLKGSKQIQRENPSDTNQILGHIEMATVEQADEAVKVAKAAFPKWSKTPVAERVQKLRKLAELMKRDRQDLMAIQIFESGKPWSEADGDIAEAIDFCDYYAGEMERLAPGTKVSFVMGESSRHHYIPKGVGLVIAPWNFPLAILSGMVAANLVTGNTVIMKPAEQSSITGAKLMDLLLEAGFPPETVSFLPGLGEEVGAHLVKHKDVNLISFTGSKEVGMAILKETSPLKKAIVEMGGKNALIIDSDADLDEAVAGVVYSAFGFSGQKCSACSRVIVLDEIYDRFRARLKEAATSIYVRASTDPHAYLGPVVDKQAYDRIMATIEKNKSEHKLLCQTDVPTGGYFVPPTIFDEVSPDSELAQEEVFGPVVAMIRAKDLDDALKIANGTKYALTGGAYSRSPENIEKIKAEFEVGNLYINRGITGALVGRHPFGGYKLSGLGSKTGGKDYLQQHMLPRVVTENTMRRGFAPDMDV